MQRTNRKADRSEHPLDLVLAAFVHRQFDLGGREASRPRRRSPPVVELEALFELAERLVARLTLDLGLVDLLDLVARVGEPVRELAVVREQQSPGRVGVESADRDEADSAIGDELEQTLYLSGSPEATL